MINSRHTGMIIWIIKILRRLHDTFYKQNVLSLAFRERVGVNRKSLNPRQLCGFKVFKEHFVVRIPVERFRNLSFLCDFGGSGSDCNQGYFK